MADRVDDSTHAGMRRVEAKLDQMIEDNREFRARMGRVETGLAAGLADVQVQLAEQSVRADRTNDRLERIERRLDLVEVEPTS